MNDRSHFAKFTERARRVLSLGQEEAQRLQHNFIGTGHLLAGLVREQEGIAARVLSSFGIEIEQVRIALEEVLGQGDRIVLGEIGLTDHAKKAIETAVHVAARLNRHYIGAEHLLLGVLDVTNSGALKMLQHLQADPEAVRARTLKMLGADSGGDDDDPPARSGYSANRFDSQARQAFVFAQEEAQRFQHNYIGTEHLLLGLVRLEGSEAGAVLRRYGVELLKLRSAVEFIIGRGDRAVQGKSGLTPRAKRVVELAVEEARRLQHTYIGAEHLLLGLLQEGQGIGTGVLESLGVRLESVRKQMLATLGGQVVSSPIAMISEKAEDPVPEMPLLEEDVEGFELSKASKQMMQFAKEEALRFQHNYIGTEHLLLGVIRLNDSVASQALKLLDLDAKKIRTTVELIIGRGDHVVLAEVRLTPRAKKVVGLSTSEAKRLQSNLIEPEHILLGLVREGEGIAAGILESLGVNMESVRGAVLQTLKGSELEEEEEKRPVERTAQAKSVVFPEMAFPLSDTAWRAIVEAREEARHWQHDHIGSEHLLLGLLRLSDCPTTQLLNSQGVDLSRARSVVMTLIGEGRSPSPPEITLTPRSRDLLQMAQREAQSLKLSEVTPEILLLTLARSGEGLALSILGSLGVDLKVLQIKLLQSL